MIQTYMARAYPNCIMLQRLEDCRQCAANFYLPTCKGL